MMDKKSDRAPLVQFVTIAKDLIVVEDASPPLESTAEVLRQVTKELLQKIEPLPKDHSA